MKLGKWTVTTEWRDVGEWARMDPVPDRSATSQRAIRTKVPAVTWIAGGVALTAAMITCGFTQPTSLLTLWLIGFALIMWAISGVCVSRGQ